MLQPSIFADLPELEANIKNISAKHVIGICPGPALADKYREYLQQIGCENIDVLTVFKFAQNLLTADPSFDSSQFLNKSTLLLSLSTLWKTNLPELSLADFQLAHKIFTDLRGHFLVPDFLETVLVDFRPEIKRCVLYFWHFLKNANVLDEHGVYGELAHQLRTPAHPAYEYLPTHTYLFFGFRHFTGVQVDFLKSLAIKHDVLVFIPRPAYLNSRATDWITWLFPDRDSDVLSEQLNISGPAIRCNVLRPNLNKHTEMLVKKLANAETTNVILAKNELNSGDLCTLYQDNYFKLESQFFSGILESVKKEVLAKIQGTQDQRLTVEELSKYIDENCKKKLKEKDFKNQRSLKVMLLIRSNLKIWTDLSSRNILIDSDIWKMVCESAQLDLPRNYLIPVVFTRHSSSIMPISGLELEQSQGGSILVVSEQFGEIVSENSVFADSILQNIAPLSPVRSSELDKNFLRFWLNLFLQQENNTLIYEQGIEERSFFWKMILGPVQQIKDESQDLPRKKIAFDVLNGYVKHSYEHPSLTASRLQNYYDCPRKFYFQELHACKLDRRSQFQLENFELGEIEHLVIKDFFEQNLELSSDRLRNLVDARLLNFLQQRAMTVKNFSLATLRQEIFEYSMNGIKAMKDLIQLYNFTSVKFEVPFAETLQGIQFKGRIDCVLENDEGHAILDFKRGEGSIPTGRAFDKFEKLQVWFYLSHYKSPKKILTFGLICLSKPDKSLIRTVENGGNALSLSEFSDIRLKDIERIDFDMQLEKYNLFEERQMRDLYNDKLFKALPINSHICEFCDLSALCSKGQI